MKNFFNKNDENSRNKTKQNILFIATIILLGGFLIGLVFFTERNKDKINAADLKENKIEIADITNTASAEDRWLEQAETKLQLLDKINAKNEILVQKITQLEANLTELKTDKENLKNHQELIDSYFGEIQRLENRINNLKIKPDNKTANSAEGKIIWPANSFPPGKEGESVNISNNITNINFKLENEKDDFNSYILNHYLPAGSYAKAIVISGVDANIGVSSQSDPRPILFRVVENAKTAINSGEIQETDITGCTVTGAASGDLSSEKIFVRLLKMTCSKIKDQVIETDVKGYAAAIGKAGIRGEVISREGDLVVKSFFAGLAGGVGQGVSKKLTAPTAIIGGFATDKSSTQEIIGQSVGSGLERSSDRVAEYLIDRAEQYQPVISIPAGIEAELVFHEGVYLDGRKIEREKKEKNL